LGFRVIRNKQGQDYITGHSTDWKVLMFFGIMLLIIGLFTLLVNYIASFIIFLIAIIILFGANRRQKRMRQEFYNDYVQREKDGNSDADIVKEIRKLEEMKRDKKINDNNVGE
jgi:uncharacterized membrane protein